jgi:pimeloyl-ACP methyl ester carboxylesterase
MPRVREYAEPPPAPAPSGPPRRGLGGEWRVGLQVARLVAATPSLSRGPRGDGAPVVLVPGWKAPATSMMPLRNFLRFLGHDARHWELGVNEGRPERDAPRLAAQVERLASAAGRPVALIGWSLGGTVAREAARQAAAVTAQVITYGTPVVGGPTHTIGARSYGPQESARISALVEELDATSPISVPITAIYTRRDGIVSWRACIDRTSTTVRHVEVSSTHISMGFDPDVWRVIADRLAPSAPR